MIKVMISGGFDPLHSGHIDYIKEASEQGDYLIVALNSDDWLMEKKGFVFMPFEERLKILLSLRNVNIVYSVDDEDGTVCEAILSLDLDIFGNGGDRTIDNSPEEELCQSLGIKTIYGLGGGKTQSSSHLASSGWVLRNWGRYRILNKSTNYVTKLLEFNGGKTSLQRHNGRIENWMCIKGKVNAIIDDHAFTMYPGDVFYVGVDIWHQIGGERGSEVIEVWQNMGELSETDIERKI